MDRAVSISRGQGGAGSTVHERLSIDSSVVHTVLVDPVQYNALLFTYSTVHHHEQQFCTVLCIIQIHSTVRVLVLQGLRFTTLVEPMLWITVQYCTNWAQFQEHHRDFPSLPRICMHLEARHCRTLSIHLLLYCSGRSILYSTVYISRCVSSVPMSFKCGEIQG